MYLEDPWMKDGGFWSAYREPAVMLKNLGSFGRLEWGFLRHLYKVRVIQNE